MNEQQRKAMELALEALKVLLDEWTPARQAQLKGMDAVAAIKEVLAQPEQEPVAWAMLHDNGYFIDAINLEEHARVEGQYKHPLYTTPPPQRTWVGLTDREKSNLWLESRAAVPRFYTYASLVEAKLKEKNNA